MVSARSLFNTSTQVFTQTMEVQKMARKWSYGSQGLCTHPLMQTGGWNGDSGRQDFKISQSPKSAEIWAAKGRRMWWLTSAGVQNFIMASEFFLSLKPQSPLRSYRLGGVLVCTDVASMGLNTPGLVLGVSLGICVHSRISRQVTDSTLLYGCLLALLNGRSRHTNCEEPGGGGAHRESHKLNFC